MAATRLLPISKPFGYGLSSEMSLNFVKSSMESRPRKLMCLANVGLNSKNPLPGVLISEPKMGKGVDLSLYVTDKMLEWMKFITRERPWRFHIQMLVEKAIVDCRFFTLLATAGSLLGSALCVVEGCFLIMESYFQYFHSLSQMSEQGHVVLLLIEAIDMFLVGTAMLVFGVAVHVMFMGQDKGLQSNSTLSKNFNLKKLPSWMRMESAVEAKSKIVHAVIVILQVQVVEKFKSMSVTNVADLVCFAGAIFLSSVSIFVLSRMANARART
ncbi:hypothetical protein STAS_19460 [Striga asiatica]|uniref:Uncharacterized protein n=1 Tax=Striga asiatica TaxID=4170 RepID=A0A5A7QBT7_STRAF|nr:hypothetical protein STAS_19460 [Striga asiatica]